MAQPPDRKVSVSELVDFLHLAELRPGRHYILFADPRVCDIERFTQISFDIDCSVEIIPIIPAPGQSVADAVALKEAGCPICGYHPRPKDPAATTPRM